MEWTYTITAASRPRVMMRIAQVFDQQMVPMRQCLLLESGQGLDISITIDVEEELALRIHAKLYKQQDVENISLAAGGRPALVNQLAAVRPAESEITLRSP
jgi:hypothetical protein